MATVNVTIKNLPQIKAAFRRAPQRMYREVALAISKSTILIGREATREVTYGPNRAIKTGRLRASIQTGRRITPTRGEIGPTVNYAIYVHEGTRYMRARPFLRAAVEKSDSMIQQFFTQAVTNVLNDIGRHT